MRILEIDPEPFHVLEYLDAAPRGGNQLRRLPLLRGRAEGLPAELDALLVSADLQGRVADGDSQLHLLGEALAGEYATLADLELVPPPAFTGVVLAGDLYAAPAANKMGATGDVREVWRAFAGGFRWVAGVAGNHDLFGTPQELSRFRREPGVHLLDGDTVELDGLRIAGVGGICGNPDKPNRRSPEAFLAAMRQRLAARPHLLVLHEGPDGGEPGLRGNPELRAALGDGPALVICGHVHWDRPLVNLAGGAQLLNVDARVVLLERPAS
jgi:Icc-related predicted phosphoesterase